MRARFAVIVLALAQIAAVNPPVPIESLPPSVPPEVSAASWILWDETNGVELDSMDPDTSRPMASTTKIMTGLMAVESDAMEDLVLVSQRAAEVGESEIGLVAGERVPMEMLVNALLIRSANDAAIAIAEHLGGSVEGFVDAMNQRAAQLGLTGTSFANPHGLDAADHVSTARDLLTLARVAMADPLFAEMVATRRYRITDAPDGTVRVAEATNLLLTTYRGAVGVKTGYTNGAGLTFVGAAERDGRMLFVVVMGSEGPSAHIIDAADLLDHGFGDLRIVDTIARGTPFRLIDADEDRYLADLAAFHALLFLASLDDGLDAQVDVVVEAPDPEVVVTADLPGISEALGWLLTVVRGG